MPVIPPTVLGLCALFAAENPDHFPFPPTGDSTGTVTFDFTGYTAANELRIVVISFEGDAVSDTAGNTYNLDLTAGFIKVWSALVEFMPVDGVDSITVTEGFGFTAIVLDSTDPVNYRGPAGSTEGLLNPTYPTPDTADVDSPAITLTQGEDWLFGGFASRISNSEAATGITFGSIALDLLPDGIAWSFVGAVGDSEAADEFPPDPSTDYMAWRGEVYGIGPSEAGFTATTGPFQFACSVSASISFPDLTYDLDYTAFILSYQGKGAGPWPPPPEPDRPFDGCDLAETSNGWLFVSKRVGADVYVVRSTNAGEDWTVGDPLATDAAASGVEEGAAPTLLAVPAGAEPDTLWCYYHTAAPALKVYRSLDLGDTWELWATHAGYRLPRALWLPPDRLFLVMLNGDLLEVFVSDDWAATDPDLVSTIGTVPPQLAGFRADRFGRVHLVYREADGDLQHRSSAAPEVSGTWTSDAEVSIVAAAEDYPAYAVGATCGFLMAFEAEQIVSALLTETDDALIGVREVPDAAFTPMYPGLIFNRFGDLLFACKDTAPGTPVYVWLSPSEGEDWQVLNSGAGF